MCSGGRDWLVGWLVGWLGLRLEFIVWDSLWALGSVLVGAAEGRER